MSAPTAEEMLAKGWEEYQFLSLELAEKQFNNALELELTAEQRIQATLGLAMSAQYAERGRDLDKAESLYQEVLSLEPTQDVRDLVTSNLADLYMARGDNDQALEYLDQLVNTRLSSVIGQDALRRKIYLQRGPFGSERSRRVADDAAERIQNLEATRERPRLLPVLHTEIGMLYFWLGDYEKAVYHLEQMTLIGSADTTSYGSQSTMLYRLAKLHENELDDPSRAGHFYRRLILEYPNSGMAYYSLVQAVEFGAMTKQEVRALNLSGMTDEILAELFAGRTGGDR
jgi:tetratricopeptide (TPR) repeat protein